MKSNSLYKKKTLLLITAILIIGIIIVSAIFLWFHYIPSREKIAAAQEFLLSASQGGNYNTYLIPQLYNHSFPLLLQELRINQFEVSKIESLDKDKCRVYVSADFPAGRIPFYLYMSCVDKEWLITGLPDSRFHLYGIPVSKIK
ncbi:MAG: hypothetical protein GX854_12925, partial [Clostridiales bacterium]|nr:hypothetical protein [Clostridiales bacterium]